MGSTFASTRNHDTFLAGQRRLSEMAGDGTLTRPLLDEAMAAMYDDGDYIDQSTGFAWILDQPELFAHTAGRCGFQVAEFLETHGPLCWVGSRVLLNGELLALVPADQRTAFVQRMYAAHGAFNNHWIETARGAGVSDDVMAELILARLAAVGDNCESSGMVDAVKDFLDYGYQYGEPTSPWSVMTAQQFDRAMVTCSAKAPGRFFAKRELIQRRLGEARWVELAKTTLPGLKRLSQEQQAFVEEQPVSYQLQIAQGLECAPAFLLRLLVKLPAADGPQRYTELEGLLAGVSLADTYRSTWASRHSEGVALAPWLEAELQKKLAAAGYVFGTVISGKFTPRGGTPRTQLQVVAGGVTYVLERCQRGYYPKAGDEVLVNSRTGHHLTPRVVAAIFLPARSGQEVRIS